MDMANSAPLGIALLGLLLGMRHATEPDHVIAVTAILSRERRLLTAARIGVVWGFGHTLTVLAVGAAIIGFKLAIPARVGLAMEFAVAIMLILLGLGAVGATVRRLCASLLRYMSHEASALVVHSHSHVHDGTAHRHYHVHAHSHRRIGDRRDGGAGIDDHAVADSHRKHTLPAVALSRLATRRPLLRSFGVGLVHGLAGSTAIALLVLSAIPRALYATLYLAIFCAGTIVGMALITTAIATPLAVAPSRMSSLHQRFAAAAGLLSFGFGIFLAYRIGVVDRLFGGVPIWTPH
jgi:high-affinity nickel-transport protein